MQHDNSVWLHLTDLMDQRILAFRHIQVGAVEALALEGIRQSCENNSNLSFLCGGNCLGKKCLINLVLFGDISLFICNVWIIPQGIQSTLDAEAVDVAGTAALCSGRLGKFADNGNLL